MSKKVVKVRSLIDVDAKYVSLVKNAATRIPFKIIKKDKGGEGMDLSSIFFEAKKEEASESRAIPTVSAVFVKNEALAAALEQVSPGSVLKEDVKGGATALYFTDDAISIEDILKLDDNASVVVTGLRKSFDEYVSSSDFGANVLTRGFYPSVSLAFDSLRSSIYKSMGEAEAGAAPVDKIASALADFSSYVITLVSSVPIEAFKFEGLAVEDKPIEESVEEGAGNSLAKADAGLANEVLEKSLKDSAVAIEELRKSLKEVAERDTGVEAVKAEVAAISETMSAAAKAGEELRKSLNEKLQLLADTVAGIVPGFPAGDIVATVKSEPKSKYGDVLDFSE